MTSTDMSGDVRAGLAQWTPDSDPGVNLRTAETALGELARRGCRLAVLPELWLCGYRTATLGADARAAVEPIDGPVQRRLAELARTTGMVLCAGSFPELDGGRLFNTAVVYGPAGNLLLRHCKRCLYGIEPTVFSPGNAVTAGDIAGIGRVGLCVCFDGDFPETARALRDAGAGLVLHPSAYEAAAQTWWDTIYPAQALCNGQWWIAANQHGGTGADRGALFMALHSAQGPRLGVPQMIQSRAQFGYFGALLVVLVAVAMYVGFFASNLVLGGQSLNQLASGISVDVGIVICAVVSLVITIFRSRGARPRHRNPPGDDARAH